MTKNVVDFPGGQRGKASLPLSEDTLAVHFVDEYGDDLRHDHETSRWYRWDGVGWRYDQTDYVMELVRNLCRNMAARGGVNAKTRDRLGQKRTFEAIERLARSDPKIAVTGNAFDAQAWALGTPGGMVSLKTQRLLPNRRTKGLLVTKRTSVTPAPPGVTPKRWVAFLDEAMGGDFELVDFLQRLCGYALTGRTHEQLLFLFWGPGGNGKGVFITIVSEVMGEYARAAPMEMFVASDAYRHETELANLRGARWVSAQESEKGRGLAESKIKALTGEDMITARFMRTDFFQFRPTHKLLLATNHKPELRGVDKAMRRRVRLVPWIVEPREVDRLLADKLRLEKAAILRWMLDGCAAWREGGLTMPTAVAAATADYLSGQDSLGQWLEEQCEVDTVPSFGDSAHRARAASLFASWKAFCESRNERPGSMNRLAEELKKKGFLPARNSAGVVYFGVGLKSQPLDEQPKSGASRLV